LQHMSLMEKWFHKKLTVFKVLKMFHSRNIEIFFKIVVDYLV
jgi:hypothetical protein